MLTLEREASYYWRFSHALRTGKPALDAAGQPYEETDIVDALETQKDTTDYEIIRQRCDAALAMRSHHAKVA